MTLSNPLIHGLELPECSLGSLIVFLLKDAEESLRPLHLKLLLCIKRRLRLRSFNIALILIIFFCIAKGVASQRYSYERVFCESADMESHT